VGIKFPPRIVLLRHFVPCKFTNLKMLWKSEKMFRADTRGMATVEMDLYGIARVR
jgi:hypothetical protein